jgi:hypothetical protein
MTRSNPFPLPETHPKATANDVRDLSRTEKKGGKSDPWVRFLMKECVHMIVKESCGCGRLQTIYLKLQNNKGRAHDELFVDAPGVLAALRRAAAAIHGAGSW